MTASQRLDGINPFLHAAAVLRSGVCRYRFRPFIVFTWRGKPGRRNSGSQCECECTEWAHSSGESAQRCRNHEAPRSGSLVRSEPGAEAPRYPDSPDCTNSETALSRLLTARTSLG